MPASRSVFTWGNLLKTVVSLGVIYWLYLNVDWETFGDTFQNIDYYYLGISIAFFLVNQIIIAWKLKRIISIVDSNIHALDILRANFIGSFLGIISPSSLGVDVVRGYYLYRSGAEKEVVISSMLLDRMLGMITVIIAGGVSLFFIERVQEYPWLIYSYALMLLLIVAFAFSLNLRLLSTVESGVTRLPFKWLVSRLLELLQAYKLFAEKRFLLLFPLILSVGVIILRIVSIYYITLALGETIFWGYYFLIIPTLIIAVMLPIAVAGIGIREGTLTAMLMLFGMTQNYAVATSLVMSITITLTVVVLGIIFLMISPKNLRTQLKDSKGQD